MPPRKGSPEQAQAGPPARGIPVWLKIAYSAYVAVLVPVYWVQYGPQNFLWACDIALLAAVAVLWRESALWAGALAVAVLLPGLAWNADFFARLAAGRDVFGLDATGYMFDAAIPRVVRALSLFHVFQPLLLVWAVHRLGYDRRAPAAASLLAWIALPASYLCTDPERNINWVYGLGEVPQDWLPGPIYLAAMMVLVPLVLYWPAHLLLSRAFGIALPAER